MEGRTREDILGQGELGKWEDLNRDCLANIFERAGMEALITSLPLVCKNWYAASLDPHCWKVLDFQSVIYSIFQKNLNIYTDEDLYVHVEYFAECWIHKIPLHEFVRFGVDRSQGIATKVVLRVNIQRDFDMMTYISNGCPILKTLVLQQADGMGVSYTEEGKPVLCLSKLIKKWKNLEHLSIDDYEDNLHDIISEISTHCNNFASLTTQIFCGETAITIATLLPNIKSLTLSRSTIDRCYLVRILSECRQLEFLDVRFCDGFDANDAEILELASHIGTFLPEGSVPFESFDDYYDDYIYDPWWY